MSEEDVTDHIAASIPAIALDSRSYYYQQYPGIKVVYSRSKFQHTVYLGTISNSTPVYVAGFEESMLLTWIGLDCSIQRRTETSYTISIKIVDGTNPYENNHSEVFTYIKVPPRVSQYEQPHVRRMILSDKIDTGQEVHVRVHSGFNLELIASFSSGPDACCSLFNAQVVLKVQHPSRVGGVHDHPSWERSSGFDRTFNSKKIKAYKAFEKYVLKGDNALYY